MFDQKPDPAQLALTLGQALGGEFPARVALFQQAVADRLGISLTDYKCLDIARRADPSQPATAGRLAELTGLTTGAITGALDRLEKAGFIRREKAPNDRRQVLIRLLPEREEELSRVLASFQQAWQSWCARYSEESLRLIQGFLQGGLQLLVQETEGLRASERSEAPTEAGRELSSPLGEAERGRLEFPRGVSQVVLGSTTEPVLYRARFTGAAPGITAQGGRVVVERIHAPFRLFSWKRQVVELFLHRSLPWSIYIRGGANRLTGDLGGLLLEALEVRGGAHEVSLVLPAPVGTVPVRITGGVHTLSLLRPPQTPTRLLIQSGAHGLQIDRLRLGSVGGETRWESPDFAHAANRYDIEITGGAHNLSLSER